MACLGLAIACAALVGAACGGKAIVDPAGSGGATSTTSSGSGGGAGGTAECTGPADCPAPSSPCEAAICVGGSCGTVAQPAGTPCDDSGTAACDGAGNCLDVCAQLCGDFTYCVNEPPDECTASCQEAIQTCSTAELQALFDCHQDFDLDCAKLMEFSECVSAVACVGE